MFIDEVSIFLKAGDGGNGSESFRTEKHVPRGGPDGGDGGKGGAIVFETNSNLSTLLDFRPGKRYMADRGTDGLGKNMFGRDGANLVLKVPPGTQIIDAVTGELILDLAHHPMREVVVFGGRGGRGNQHFVNSIQQAPKFSEKGEPGEERGVKLELKLLADVGLLGFPNVGKSTLLARVSAARPKIADYPFTTLVPNLGVVRIDENRSFVMADIPGVIENAHQGAGLGIQFLKHLERTRILVHIIDVSGLSGREILEDFDIINKELAAFSEPLSRLPQIVALSRIDVVTDRTDLDPIVAFFAARGIDALPISSVTGEGIDPLLYRIGAELDKIPIVPVVATSPVRITATKTVDDDPRRFTVVRDTQGVLVVSGKGLERAVAMTDMKSEEGVRRLQRKLERWGVYEKLKLAGAIEGDAVRIRDIEFDYIDEDLDDTEDNQVEVQEF